MVLGLFLVSTQPLALCLSLSLAEESVMQVTCEWGFLLPEEQWERTDNFRR